MADSNPERELQWQVVPRALFLGVAMGIVAFSGASLVLYDAAGILTGLTGLVATLVTALGVGLWAGAPAALADPLPIRERWFAAGVTTGLAGAFATFWNLSGDQAGGAVGRVAALTLLLAAPAYAFGLLLPTLTAWGERLERDMDDPIEGWGTLGWTMLAVLAGIAVGVVAAGLFLIPQLRPGPLLLGTAVALLVPFILPEQERAAVTEQTLHEGWTPYGSLRVTEVVYPAERQPERRLYLNDEEESGELVRSGAPTLAYIAASEAYLAQTTAVGSSFLFLGGGAYTLPRRVAERDPHARITVVELDPEVTRLAYRFFGLRRDHGISSIHGDARAFLEQAGDERWDGICVDVYGGTESVPYPLVTREAFAQLRSHLSARGVALLNLIGVTTGPESLRLWSVIRTAEEVFPAIAAYTHFGIDFPERQNVLVVGSADAGGELPQAAGMFERLPREAWPSWGGTTVFRDFVPGGAAHGTEGEPPAGPKLLRGDRSVR